MQSRSCALFTAVALAASIGATGATARYFELGRVPRGDPSRYVRMRVLRCAYLDRTGVELSMTDGYAGTLHERPLDAAALRSLSEYLWLFTTYNNAGHVVVASEAERLLGAASQSGAGSIRASAHDAERVLTALTTGINKLLTQNVGDVERTLLGVSAEVVRGMSGKADELASALNHRSQELTRLLDDKGGGFLGAFEAKSRNLSGEISRITGKPL